MGPTRRGAMASTTSLPASETLLPVPESLAELLPGSLPRGSVAVLSGARSLPLRLVAAVTAEGGHAAIVGQPDVGLLAAVEMGADLSRLAVIPDPGADPVEVAAVLMDGLDLVVLGLGGRSVAPTRARAVTARARQKGCTLLVTDGDWHGASARLESRVCGYEVTGAGAGAPDPGMRPDQSGAAGDQGVGPGRRPCARSGRMTCRAGCWPSGAWTGPRWRRPRRRACPRPIPSWSRWPTASSRVRRRPARPGCGRGLRRREAQARCPHVHVVTADPGRDARHFEGVTAAVDEVVPRAEVLRPGLLVLSVRGAARYFGSEQAASERLVDAVAAAGAECQVGIADQMPTAVFAARAGCIVEPGGDASFLAALSIRQLATEPSLAAPGRDDLADLLWRMGIRSIGQFAALPRTDVASRFGADAITAHRFARGEPDPRAVGPGVRRRISMPSWTAIRRWTGWTPQPSPADRWPVNCTAAWRRRGSAARGWRSMRSPPTARRCTGSGGAPSR